MLKNMRSGCVALILVLGLLPVTGCADKEPDDVAREFFNAKKDTDYQASYALISDEDKKLYTLEDAEREMESWDVYWAAKVLDSTSYSIKGYEVDGDHAVVSYEVTEPDLDHVYSRATQVAIDEPGSFKRNYEEFMNDYVDENPFRLTTRRDELNLVLEDGWKIFANIDEIERKARVRKLYNDARMAEISGELQEAESLYKELLEIDPGYEDALDKFSLVRERLGVEQAQDAYADQDVEVYDIDARYFESRYDGSVPGVTYKVRNSGDRALDKVAVRFGFMDSDGVEIYQDVLHPVLVSDYSPLNDPLLPGHIWSTERGKFHSMKRVPDEWEPGQVTAEVVEVEFSND